MTTVAPLRRATLAALVRRCVADDGREAPTELHGATGHELLLQARADRVVPALAAAVRDGAIGASDDDAAAITDAWNAVMRRCLLLDDRLLWLQGELTDLGIEMRVLKGPAAAHLDHRLPELRQYGDLDVLVRGDDLPRVFALLERDGFHRTYATPSATYDRRFLKSASFRGDVEVDVHRTIADAPLGHRIPIGDLWGAGTEFHIGGTTLHALSPEQRLLHACMHSHLGSPPTPLSSHADVVALLLGAVDPQAVHELAARWQLTSVIAAAIDSSVAQLWWPTSLDPRWRSTAEGTVVDGLLVAAHRSPRSSSTVRTVLSMLTLPSWRDRVDFVAELALPGSSYAANHPDRARQLTRALSAAIGRPTT